MVSMHIKVDDMSGEHVSMYIIEVALPRILCLVFVGFILLVCIGFPVMNCF